MGSKAASPPRSFPRRGAGRLRAGARRSGRLGPSSGAAVGAVEPAPRACSARVTCGGSGSEGRPRRAPGGARPEPRLSARPRCPEQTEGTGPRVSWRQQGADFSLGRTRPQPRASPSKCGSGLPGGACRDRGAPLPRRSRSSSPLGEVCSVRPPAAVWPPGAPKRPKTTNEPTNSSPNHPFEKRRLGLVPGFAPFLTPNTPRLQRH